jgi:hypothetical protein
MGKPVFHKGEVVTVRHRPLGGWAVLGRMPQLGETGTIRHVLTGVGVIYVVDRRAEDGSVEWLCEFAEGDVELPSQSEQPYQLSAGRRPRVVASSPSGGFFGRSDR